MSINPLQADHLYSLAAHETGDPERKGGLVSAAEHLAREIRTMTWALVEEFPTDAEREVQL